MLSPGFCAILQNALTDCHNSLWHIVITPFSSLSVSTAKRVPVTGMHAFISSARVAVSSTSVTVRASPPAHLYTASFALQKRVAAASGGKQVCARRASSSCERNLPRRRKAVGEWRSMSMPLRTGATLKAYAPPLCETLICGAFSTPVSSGLPSEACVTNAVCPNSRLARSNVESRSVRRFSDLGASSSP